MKCSIPRSSCILSVLIKEWQKIAQIQLWHTHMRNQIVLDEKNQFLSNIKNPQQTRSITQKIYTIMQNRYTWKCGKGEKRFLKCETGGSKKTILNTSYFLFLFPYPPNFKKRQCVGIYLLACILYCKVRGLVLSVSLCMYIKELKST